MKILNGSINLRYEDARDLASSHSEVTKNRSASGLRVKVDLSLHHIFACVASTGHFGSFSQ